MSTTTIYGYNEAGNFTFDNTKIEIVDDVAALKLQHTAYPFTQEFTTDDGFNYDNTKVEFTGGVAQQIDQRIAGALAYWSFTTDGTANWTNSGASGSGTLYGTAAISAGKLALTATGSSFITAGDNWVFGSQGAIRFKWTPSYSGNPVSAYTIFSLQGVGNAAFNAINMTHETNSRMNVRVYTSAGALVTSFFATVVAVSGQEYVIELNIDATGTSRLFVGGVLGGSAATVYTRTNATPSNLTFLPDGQSGGIGRFTVDDIITFNAVQHTAAHTGELPFTYPNKAYVETVVELPEMEHTAPGTILQVLDLDTTVVGTPAPRYTLQVGQSGDYLYWDGADWSVSDGSYAQATTLANFVANCETLDVDGEEFGQFKVHFSDSNVQGSIDQLIVTVDADTGYLTTNPSILTNSPVTMDDLIDFVETATKEGTEEIKYTLKIGTSEYYHTGTVWVISNGTYAQANTVSEVSSAAEEFIYTLGDGASVKINAFLHSSDGLTTPELSNIEVDYDYFGATEALEMVTVYGYVYNNSTAIEGAEIKVRCSEAFIDNNNLMDVNIGTTSRENGYFEFEVPKTHDAGATLTVEIKYVDEQGWTKKKVYEIDVTGTTAQQQLEDLIVE